MPSLSTVSWKYTQEKWPPSSRDLQKAWTGSRAAVRCWDGWMVPARLLAQERRPRVLRPPSLLFSFSEKPFTSPTNNREGRSNVLQVDSTHGRAHP